MKNAIDDLVNMRDSQSLLEIMNDSDDELLQLDAAAGLVQLGDRRGMEFLLVAVESDDKDLRAYAGELLASPDFKRLQDQIAADEEKRHQARLLEARRRLEGGRKVFRYKLVPVTPRDIVAANPQSSDLNVPELDDAGLEGWEAVNFLPYRDSRLSTEAGATFVGAYLLLKKELTPAESSDLEQRGAA